MSRSWISTRCSGEAISSRQPAPHEQDTRARRAHLPPDEAERLLINTARGPIIDQRALHEVLAAGRIAGAGLDVFRASSRTPADEPLRKLDNVIVTPHALCWSDECFAGNGAAVVRAVLALKRGEPIAGVVNPEAMATWPGI